MTQIDKQKEPIIQDWTKDDFHDVKVRIINIMSQYINNNGFSQKQIAYALDIPQSRINGISQRKYDDFKLEALINFGNQMGFTTSLTINFPSQDHFKNLVQQSNHGQIGEHKKSQVS